MSDLQEELQAAVWIGARYLQYLRWQNWKVRPLFIGKIIIINDYILWKYNGLYVQVFHGIYQIVFLKKTL